MIVTNLDITKLEVDECLIFDEERKDILRSVLSIDIQACPGSGKTSLIAAKLNLLIDKWNLKNQGICVLSHTNVAKDEIVERLKSSKNKKAYTLLSSPHFIGTIQEFVNRYIALPFIRSKGIIIKFIDDNVFVDIMYARLSYTAKNYINMKNQHGGNVLFDFPLVIHNGNIDCIVPSFKNQNSTAPTFLELKRLRIQMLNEGFFFYKDLFVYAELALIKNPSIKKSIRKRFPFVLLDEMQDTQKFQDILLNNIFISGQDASIVQRFGDPDQAIFVAQDGADANESYNSKTAQEMFKVLNNSNRFLSSIAQKVKGLSKNKVPLISAVSDVRQSVYAEMHSQSAEFRHTIFIFNDQTILNVLSRFAELVETEFRNPEELIIKALGANGSETSQFTIQNYFPSYQKNKNFRNFKTDYLIDAFHLSRESKQGNLSENIKIINQSIVDMLRKLNLRDDNGNFITMLNFEKWLKHKEILSLFRSFVFKIIEDERLLVENIWREYCYNLKDIFQISHNDNHEYLNFRAREVVPGADRVERGNFYFSNRCKVEISTIHGVKGETHHATLVLETMNRVYDISSMLPWIIDPELNVPTQITKKKFMKQLYVAVTRAKHLLCMAIHTDRISPEQIQQLESLGWNVVQIE